jgi:Na+/H+ antiporter NhaD/arsenite permease-like protein
MKYLPIAGAACLLISAIVIATYWIGMLRKFFFKRPYSMIPLIGGLIGAIGLLIFARLRGAFWLPLLADPGCAVLATTLLLSRRQR